MARCKNGNPSLKCKRSCHLAPFWAWTEIDKLFIWCDAKNATQAQNVKILPFGLGQPLARPPDFNDKLHFRHYPARSVYQRPGQAILSKSKPNGRFINARPSGRFIKAEATGWPDSTFQRQIQFRYYPARSFYQRPGQAILSKSRPNGRFINARPNGRFIKAEATGWPDLQISATNCIFAIIRTISLSAAGPSYSQQKRPNGRFINARPDTRFEPRIASSILSRAISLSAAGPSHFQQKQAQWPF